MKRLLFTPLLLAAAAARTPAAAPATRPAVTKAGIIVSKETTYVDGPLLDDGTIDYVAALNAFAGAGVTKDNNAAALLIKIIGDEYPLEDPAVRAAVYKMIGVEQPEKPDPRMMSFEQYMKDNKLVGDGPGQTAQQRVWDLLGDVEKRVITAEESADLFAWIATQETGLNILVEASKRPKLFLPAVAKNGSHAYMDAAVTPSFISSSIRTLQFRASFRLAAGDFTAARRDTLAALRLGRLIRNSATNVGGIMGQVTEHRVLNQLRAWAAADLLTADQIKILLADFAALPEIDPRASLGERFMMLDLQMQIARGQAAAVMRLQLAKFDAKADVPVGDLAQVDVNVLLRKVNALFTLGEEIDRLPYRQRRDALAAEIKKRANSDVPELPLYSFFNALSNGEMPGDAPATQTGKQTVAEFLKRRDREEIPAYSARMAQLFFEQPGALGGGFASGIQDRDAMVPLTQIALALAAYKADHKNYPDTLAALAPKYLTKIPPDYFTDADPLYRRENAGYVLYSLGGNLVDDHAVTRKEKNGADDLVVRVK